MPLTLAQLREKGAYFHVVGERFALNNEFYSTACLVSGLRRLGVPVYSNVEDTRFDAPPEGAPRPGLHVIEMTDANYSEELVRLAVECEAVEKFVLCRSDGVDSISTPPGVPALMAHSSAFLRIKGIRLPWAFGLSDEVMDATSDVRLFEGREPVILRNFTPSANQHVRNVLDWALVPHLERHFKLDRAASRKSEHFAKLGRYAGCLAYGGTWWEDLSSNEYFARHPTYQAYQDRVTFLRPLAVIRWDSWRWWESLAAGCLAFHLDFEKYGFQLPVMPEAWRHYVAIDLTDPKATVERLMDERRRWPEIAANGREWARSHYSPDAVAARLVDYVSPAEAPAASERAVLASVP